MGDDRGLVWRDGEQPLDAWIGWVRTCLVGDGRFRVIGDVRWPDEPYGRQLHSGLDAAGLAKVFRAAGVHNCWADTSFWRTWARLGERRDELRARPRGVGNVLGAIWDAGCGVSSRGPRVTSEMVRGLPVASGHTHMARS